MIKSVFQKLITIAVVMHIWLLLIDKVIVGLICDLFPAELHNYLQIIQQCLRPFSVLIWKLAILTFNGFN